MVPADSWAKISVDERALVSRGELEGQELGAFAALIEGCCIFLLGGQCESA